MQLLTRWQRSDKNSRLEATTPLISNRKRSQPDGRPRPPEATPKPQRCTTLPGRFRIARSRSLQTSSPSTSSRASSQCHNHTSSSFVPELTFVAASELQENPLRDSELPYNIHVAPSRLLTIENHLEEQEDDIVSEISLEGFTHAPEGLQQDTLLGLPSLSTDDGGSEVALLGSGGENMDSQSGHVWTPLGDCTREEEEEEEDPLSRMKSDEREIAPISRSRSQLDWTMQCFEDSTEVQLHQMIDQWSAGFSF